MIDEKLPVDAPPLAEILKRYDGVPLKFSGMFSSELGNISMAEFRGTASDGSLVIARWRQTDFPRGNFETVYPYPLFLMPPAWRQLVVITPGIRGRKVWKRHLSYTLHSRQVFYTR